MRWLRSFGLLHAGFQATAQQPQLGNFALLDEKLLAQARQLILLVRYYFLQFDDVVFHIIRTPPHLRYVNPPARNRSSY